MVNYDTKSIMSILNDEIYVDSYSPEVVEVPFDIKPEDFLRYAQNDKNQYSENDPESNRHLLNSLSNVKRALECQIDSLLIGCGLSQISKKKNWSFPQKIGILNQIGIVSPKILNKINHGRNLLEHQYTMPNPEKVEDALDVSTLFIQYTDRYLKKAVSDFQIIDETQNEDYDVEFDYRKGRIRFVEHSWVDNTHQKNIKKEISPDSSEYIQYLSWFLEMSQKCH